MIETNWKFEIFILQKLVSKGGKNDQYLLLQQNHNIKWLIEYTNIWINCARFRFVWRQQLARFGTILEIKSYIQERYYNGYGVWQKKEKARLNKNP